MARKTEPADLITGDDATVAKVRARCQKSIFWTAWYICEFRDISIVLHFAVCLWFQRNYAKGRRWFLLLIPRGHFKTSVMDQAFIVHELIKDPNQTILLVMHNLDEAKKKGRKIRSVLLGRPMKTYFPERVPADAKKLGTTTEFSVIRTTERSEASVTLAGIQTGLVGGHYDKILIDDGIEFKAANSEATMAMAVEFLEALDPLFESEDSLLLIIGTLWPGGEKGWYEQLLADPDYCKLVLGCYINDVFMEFIDEMGIKLPDPDSDYTQTRILEANRDLVWQMGQPIFPERRTMKGLEKTLSKMKPYKFAHQMLNVLVAEGSRKFKREDFLAADLHWSTGGPRAISIDGVTYPYKLGNVTTAMDPIGGLNKDSDHCGISTFWWHQTLRFAVLLDYFHDSGIEPMDQIKKFYEQACKWNADIMIPESGSMQVWVESWLKNYMVEQERYFRVEPYSTRGVTKGRRILDGFHPYVANHQVFVLYPEHEEFVAHMVGLNIAPDGTVMGSSPALADTCAMHSIWWEPGGRPKPQRDHDSVVDEDEFENARKRRRGNGRVRYGLVRRTGGF